MPQLKKPVTLYNICLKSTRRWILSVAIDLSKHFGNYDNLKCQEIVRVFHQYLITNVAASVIDELYNSPEILNIISSKSNVIDEHIPLDEKIVLAIYINKNMKTLMCHKIVNDNFWKMNLNSLSNLVKLDLNKVCTDEILEVVGKNCTLLEVINILSKLCTTRTKFRHNALKLQLCVSDVGLGFLSNCKRLKEIEMTCIIRKGCGGCKVTNEGIKRLLISLPALRRINYTDTGTLLDSASTFSQKLSLISVTDYHPSPARIPNIELLCPYLTELHLTYAFSSCDHRSEIISAITSSKLQISTLTLNNFSFDGALKQYLEVKGSHLKVFNFLSDFTKSEETTKIVLLLGHSCPNLETLHIQQHVQLGFNYIYQYCCTEEINSKLFCNLKTLVMKAIYWDSVNILPILLKNASCIQNVVISNHSFTDCMDNTFKFIQETNQFNYLEFASFSKGINLSCDFLRTFISDCTVLKYLTIESDSEEYVKLVEKMSEELYSKNVDINIDVYNTL